VSHGPRRILRVQRMLFPIGTMESRSRKPRLAAASLKQKSRGNSK
jgi:hypothetical protein